LSKTVHTVFFVLLVQKYEYWRNAPTSRCKDW
jgi:hypothetical protein